MFNLVGTAPTSNLTADMFALQANGDENVGLMKRFGVAGFPSIYLLRDGKTWAYKETRSFVKVGFECKHILRQPISVTYNGSCKYGIPLTDASA
jgi:hypothetical protein